MKFSSENQYPWIDKRRLSDFGEVKIRNKQTNQYFAVKLAENEIHDSIRLFFLKKLS